MTAMNRRRLCLNLALVLLFCFCMIPHAAAGTAYLQVDGVSYSADGTHSGDGWSYTCASGMGYLRLNSYEGGSIYLPLSSSVEFDGTSLITADTNENAISCDGDVLTIGSSDPKASLSVTGGSGAPAIYGSSVSLWGWGQLYAYGGSGASAVWGGSAVLATMEQMVLMGGQQIAISTDLGGIIKVSGAHRYYAGMSESTAVESTFYSGEIYLRAEAARATVTFDAAGGKVNGQDSYSVTLVVTTSGTDLAVYTPQRENYSFLGWNTMQDGSGSPPPARLFTGGELTYYALWERVPTVLPIPAQMLAQKNAVIYAVLYYKTGQLWTVLEGSAELTAFSLPELPETGMRYAIFCVDRNSFRPLTRPDHGTLS